MQENTIKYGLYIHDSILNDQEDKVFLVALYDTEEEANKKRDETISTCEMYKIENCHEKIFVKEFKPNE